MVERIEFEEILEKAFTRWKSDPTDLFAAQELNTQVEFARKNGIDLRLTIPMNVITKEDKTVAMSGEIANIFSTALDGDLLAFDLPSETHMRGKGIKRITGKVMDSTGRFDQTAFILKHPDYGAFGIVFASEIDSLKLK